MSRRMGVHHGQAAPRGAMLQDHDHARAAGGGSGGPRADRAAALTGPGTDRWRSMSRPGGFPRISLPTVSAKIPIGRIVTPWRHHLANRPSAPESIGRMVTPWLSAPANGFFGADHWQSRAVWCSLARRPVRLRRHRSGDAAEEKKEGLAAPISRKKGGTECRNHTGTFPEVPGSSRNCPEALALARDCSGLLGIARDSSRFLAITRRGRLPGGAARAGEARAGPRGGSRATRCPLPSWPRSSPGRPRR